VLHGTRVVELGVWVAGPGAGGVLADWGADVIKVEPPEGDPMRRMLAVTGGGRDDLPSPPFDLDNRGKRSVVLDLADPDGAGREALERLLATADVFLTNLRPDAVERLGLSPEAVGERHPRLVYASVTGYGRRGPDAHRAGYDVGGFWARSGLAALSVPTGAPQPQFRGGVGDHVTAITTVAGILGALLERHRTGRGRLVETSLLRTGIWCLGWDLHLQLRLGTVGGTLPRTEASNPMINPYQAGDGRWFWLLGTESQRLWVKLLPAIGFEALADDERFASPRVRRHNAESLVQLLDARFAERPMADWVEAFDAHDVWWAPVNGPADVLEDPQAIAAGAFVEVPGGDGAPQHRGVASPVSFPTGDGDDSSHPRGSVPALGEHTAEVLAELGI
jgi:crotonobetainyl-CoA:carnitine CoA-transferase CaiB-like acyl-CoA transferase